jgi:hypothetical protein
LESGLIQYVPSQTDAQLVFISLQFFQEYCDDPTASESFLTKIPNPPLATHKLEPFEYQTEAQLLLYLKP